MNAKHKSNKRKQKKTVSRDLQNVAMEHTNSEHAKTQARGASHKEVQNSKQSIDVFISYSHKDRFWKDWLLADRILLTTAGTIDVWSDEDIRPSDDWRKEINRALRDARVAVLLVSKNFLASQFIKDQELPKILRNRREKKASVLWIPVEGNLEGKVSDKLGNIQAAHPPGSPLNEILEKQSTDALASARELIHDHIRRELDPNGWRVRKVLDSKYEVVRTLGEGPTRSVFLGREHIMKRWVAIMALNNQDKISDRRDQLEEFRRSLLFASRVDDIGCFLTIYDAWLDRNPPHCVRQYTEGETLDEHLSYGGLAYGYVRDILLRLGRGLEAAHARGFVHLNIKPSNIIIDERDRAYLSSLSRRPNYYDQVKARWAKLEREDRAYVVPEFFDRGVPNIAFPKCDQYLLGILGYHMITGGKAPCRVKLKDRYPPESLQDFKELKSDIDPACPKTLIEVVMKMSQLHPDDRFVTLGEAMDRLSSFKDESLTQARDSYHRIATHGHEDKLFREFYAKFLGIMESKVARDRFEHMGKKAWERQREMLKEAILLLLAFGEFDAVGCHDNPQEPTVLSRTMRTHRELDIPVNDYDKFGDLLIDVLVSKDPACGRDKGVVGRVQRAWRQALMPGLAYMKRNAASRPV